MIDAKWIAFVPGKHVVIIPVLDISNEVGLVKSV